MKIRVIVNYIEADGGVAIVVLRLITEIKIELYLV